LLIDTYDTVAAAARLAEKVNKGTMALSGVRLDSGDLVSLSQQVRALLPETKIFASGDLDEWEISRLKEQGAVIDGYGLGTRLVTGNPVNGVYKLVEIDGIPTMKASSQKMSFPGKKQIFRRENDSIIQQDRLGLVTEIAMLDEQPLLQQFMSKGKRLQTSETLEIIRQRSSHSVASLPAKTRNINDPISVTVAISETLQQLRDSLLYSS
jgi:nicotinate phosphoribosyltransferase